MHLFLEAVIQAAVVLLGIAAAAHVDRRNRRRDLVERSVLQFQHEFGQLISALAEPGDRGEGSVWWDRRQRCWALITEVRTAAQGYRRAKLVATEAEAMLQALAAIDLLIIVKGVQQVSPAIVLELSTNALHDAAFGEREATDEGQMAAIEGIVARIEALPMPDRRVRRQPNP